MTIHPSGPLLGWNRTRCIQTALRNTEALAARRQLLFTVENAINEQRTMNHEQWRLNSEQ
eukprot:113475-Lingulodinium_polyedra.AAC.1